MSIRYDRQYKQNVDIDGPVGPNTNDDSSNLSFLNNNDVYLGGGGGTGGGGSAPVEPPVYTDPPYTTDPPIDIIQPTPENPTPNDLLVPIVNYEIAISSNLQEEVGDFIKLKYDILSNGAIQEQGDVLLSDGNTDGLSSVREVLKSGILNLYLENNLPSNYSISKIYYTNKLIATKNPTDYTKWNVGNNFIGIQASELLTGGVAVAVIIEKVINSPKPTIFLNTTTYSKQIKDSDGDTIINVDFKEVDCNYIDFYLSETKSIRVESGTGNCAISFLNNFDGIYGNKKIIAVPYSDLYGTGDKVEIIINFIAVNDTFSPSGFIYDDNLYLPNF
jgi:hypothetical protein